MKTFSKKAQHVVRLIAALALSAAAFPAVVASAATTDTVGYGLGQAYAIAGCDVQSVQLAPHRRSATPPLAGLVSLHNDVLGYDLWGPAGWSVTSLWRGSATDTIQLSPDVTDPSTHFTIQVAETGALTADNLPGRMQLFDTLINALPDARVVWQARWFNANVAGFEAKYTYRDTDTAMVRWVRLLYMGSRQYYLIAEAPLAADSATVQSAFLPMMLTFHPDEQLELTAVDTCTS